ncbi:MAG TPA: HIT family protein [Ktedonobacterales bacterium]|nr:HIT family protein [Ktedonobacterales bacterium]
MTPMEPSEESTVSCYSCEALRGERHISPAEHIYDGRYWIVDHAWPTALVGWVVLVLRRHAAALHELTADEFAEMGALLARTARALHMETGCAKEYLACFAEADHFQHVHMHVVPRASDLPHELQGPRSFALLKPTDHTLASVAEVQAFCARIRAAMKDH